MNVDQRPLPPGWEAKFDHRINRYFYLNHATQSTQWDDPRQGYYASLARSQGQARAQQAPRPSPKAAAPRPANQAASPKSSQASAKASAYAKSQQAKASALQKMQMRHKMRNKFPSHPDLLIEMALESSGWDEAKTSILLSDAGKPSQKKQAGQGSGTSIEMTAPTTTAAAASRSGTTMATTSFSATSVGQEAASRPSTTSSSSATTANSSDSVGAKPAPAVSQPKAATKATAAKAKPKPVTIRVELRSKKPAAQKKPEYKSSLTTATAGPNPALHHGPNSHHLGGQHSTALGADRSLATGPRAENVHSSFGRQAPAGRSSLAKGPDHTLYQGPNSTLITN